MGFVATLTKKPWRNNQILRSHFEDHSAAERLQPAFPPRPQRRRHFLLHPDLNLHWGWLHRLPRRKSTAFAPHPPRGISGPQGEFHSFR
jgi:hypothetical protein